MQRMAKGTAPRAGAFCEDQVKEIAMTGLRKLIAVAVAGGAIASAALVATPAAAFDPVYNDGSRPYWGDYYGGPHFRHHHRYGYSGYAYPDYGPDYEVGSTVVAVCPPGYVLG